MIERLKSRVYRLLRWSEKYTKTDMVYVGTSGFWLTLGQGISTLSGLLLSIVFANFLSKEVFGVYRYILSVTGALSAFSLTGMKTVITRAVAQGYDGTFKHSIRLQLVWTLPQFFLTVCVALYYLFQGNSMFALAFGFVAVLGPLSNVFNNFNVFLQGKQDFRTSTTYTTASTMLQLVAITSIVFLAPAVAWLVAAYYGTITLSSMYLCYRAFKKYPTTNHEVRAEDITYAKRLSIMNAVTTLANQADSLIVYHLLGPAQLAVYSFSTLLPDRIRTIMSNLSSAILPKLAEKHGGTRESLTRKMLQLSLLSVLIIVVYIGTAPFLFGLIFPAYTTSVFYSQLYALTLLMLPSYVTMPALYARRNERALFVLNIVVPCTKVVLSLTSIILLGIVGAVLARIMYYLLYMGVAAYYVRTQTPTTAI